MTTKTSTTEQTQKPADSPLAIASLITGTLSLTGPGLLLGIPAIILGAISLSKKQGGRNLSIAGIITGAISTLLSLLFIAFMVMLFIWGANDPDFQQEWHHEGGSNEQLFESSRT
ncbi:MAG TPA: DUF4190 domain-containing protein [Candidatus Saccharimonadales bacterium]